MRLPLAAVIFLLLSLPGVYSQGESVLCSNSGYTVLTLNGIWTNERDAQDNKDALRQVLGRDYQNEKVNVDFLWNQTHLAGLGDVLKAVEQGIFDDEVIADFDLMEMLEAASQKVNTQKLLLVAHSQGNFYANSFHDMVVDKEGGVPKESIGVYGVATPSSRVAGGGNYLTSSNDEIIAGLVSRVHFRSVLPANVVIPKDSTHSLGHKFSEIYLKYQGARIVSEIHAALGALKNNEVQKAGEVCIDPPAFSIWHEVKGIGFAIADPSASVVKTVTIAGVSGVYHTGLAAVKLGLWTGGKIVDLGNFVGQKAGEAAVFAYQATKTLAVSTREAVDYVVAAVYSNLSGANLFAQSAAVVTVARNSPVKVASLSLNEKALVEEALALSDSDSDGAVVGVVTEGTPAPSVSEGAGPNPTPPSNSGPKIIFIGPMPGYGGGVPSQITENQPTVANSEVVIETLTNTNNEPPASLAISVPQCAESLSADGCLLATTTLRFSWSPIAGAAFYAIDQDGNYSTTTNTSIEVVVVDFSDYSFGLAAVSVDGSTSATSTQRVSVATIPIAINEIAWMGTQASASDEWLELKNNTNYTIDLSDWVIETADGTPRIALTGSIRPYEYLVFERTSDETLTDVLAYQIYTGALSNDGERLVLSRASTILDSTPIITGNTWAGGSNTSSAARTTMERYIPKEDGANPNNWGSNINIVTNGLDAEGNQIFGTPGERNSLNYLINKGQEITTNLELGEEERLYIITSPLEVAASSTLSIEPGVVIKFDEGSELVVSGHLEVSGTVGDPVIFKSLSDSQAGEVVFESSVGTSTIVYADFEDTLGITVNGESNLAIASTTFTENRKGIEVNGEGVVTIKNSSFASTTNEVVAVYGEGLVSVSSSTIDNTLRSDAVGIYDGGTVSFASTTISNTQRGDAIGVYDSNLNLASTTINGVRRGDAIGAYDSNISIENSIIENGEGDGVGVYGGTATIEDSIISGFTDGVGLIVSAPDEIVEITNTEITGNNTGVEAYSANSVSIEPESMVHDNGNDESDDIVIFD